MQQGLLKDQLQIMKVKSNGKIRYAIQSLDEQLSFDKVCVPCLRQYLELHKCPHPDVELCCIAGLLCLHTSSAIPHKSQSGCDCGEPHVANTADMQAGWLKSSSSVAARLSACDICVGGTGWSLWLW